MEPNMIDAVGRLATQVGLPAVVLFWLMFRSDQIISAHTKAIQELTIAIKEWRASKGQ